MSLGLGMEGRHRLCEKTGVIKNTFMKKKKSDELSLFFCRAEKLFLLLKLFDRGGV